MPFAPIVFVLFEEVAISVVGRKVDFRNGNGIVFREGRGAGREDRGTRAARLRRVAIDDGWIVAG